MLFLLRTYTSMYLLNYYCTIFYILFTLLLGAVVLLAIWHQRMFLNAKIPLSPCQALQFQFHCFLVISGGILMERSAACCTAWVDQLYPKPMCFFMSEQKKKKNTPLLCLLQLFNRTYFPQSTPYKLFSIHLFSFHGREETGTIGALPVF